MTGHGETYNALASNFIATWKKKDWNALLIQAKAIQEVIKSGSPVLSNQERYLLAALSNTPMIAVARFKHLAKKAGLAPLETDNALMTKVEVFGLMDKFGYVCSSQSLKAMAKDRSIYSDVYKIANSGKKHVGLKLFATMCVVMMALGAAYAKSPAVKNTVDNAFSATKTAVVRAIDKAGDFVGGVKEKASSVTGRVSGGGSGSHSGGAGIEGTGGGGGLPSGGSSPDGPGSALGSSMADGNTQEMSLTQGSNVSALPADTPAAPAEPVVEKVEMQKIGGGDIPGPTGGGTIALDNSVANKSGDAVRSFTAADIVYPEGGFVFTGVVNGSMTTANREYAFQRALNQFTAEVARQAGAEGSNQVAVSCQGIARQYSTDKDGNLNCTITILPDNVNEISVRGLERADGGMGR